MNRLALFALVTSLMATPSFAAMDWTSLWRNADQRGEQLLKKGDADAAAKTFSDPRRKAFAELRAGDNDSAARDFGAFDDSDAHYNRGNALAKSGRLDDALKAYDSALERNPDNRDAKQNRDLVAKALEQQKQQQNQQQSPNGPSGDQKKGNDGNGKNDQNAGKDKGGKPSQQPPQSSSGNGSGNQPDQANQQGEQKSPSSANSGSPKPTDTSASDKGTDQQAGSSAKDGTAQQAEKKSKDASSKDGAQGNSHNPQSNDAGSPTPAQMAPEDEKQQARQDAAAGLKQAEQDPHRNPVRAAASMQDSGRPGGDPVAVAPVSEQKLAEDQWLRRIPDDPGGLLRRKFMLEHLQKEQQQTPQNDQP